MALERVPRYYAYVALAVCHVAGAVVALVPGQAGAFLALLGIACFWMAAAYTAEASQ